jgi:hypothetical protein
MITPTRGKCIVILAKARTSFGKVYFTRRLFFIGTGSLLIEA